jgi:peptidoglycan/xylan/chitin deacetylase (PgdA/CDA1 family)
MTRNSEPGRNITRNQPGALVISLDFELQWGVRDHRQLDAKRSANLLATRAGIPRILDLFAEFSVHATWATVGLLFAKSRAEAQAFSPSVQPHYQDVRLTPYREELGKDERDDPFHFAPSIISRIASCAGQEIGSHSFSHYYCLEAGQTERDFEADLESAMAIAANSGYALRSFVFPRNEVNVSYLSALRRSGFLAYRANERASVKQAAPFSDQRQPHKRLARLLDSYIDVFGPQSTGWPENAMPLAIASSRYLRSYNPRLRLLDRLLLARIAKAMEHAAREGEIFHLWWHPEDFASDYDQNLRMLRRVLELFAVYRAQYRMESLAMAEVCSRVALDNPSGHTCCQSLA